MKTPDCNIKRLILLMSGVTGIATADTGGFSTLTYNIAGLPEIFSSAESNRQTATEQISCYVNEFDFVNVQEDFNYHAALYDTCNNHPYRSPTTGGMGFGSGLNTMSRFAYKDWTRVVWEDCSAIDCWTPKGFTLARTRLKEGVYVDIYNLHAQAQTEDADLAARRSNILQLADSIETHSAANAVIILGDTNTRYTRSGDNIRELINRGFSDAWVELLRNGDLPVVGADALTCDPKITSPNCEIVDKVLYRGNGYIDLQASYYAVRQDDETSDGLKLSDHPPVQTNWRYTTRSDRGLSDAYGGANGTAYNDVMLLPENPAVKSLSLRSGVRVDKVEITLSNGYIFSHGGNGGHEKSLLFTDNEYLTSLFACSGKKDGDTQIFHARFTTNLGRTLAGGVITPTCSTFNAPNGWQIVGFHGRSGDELNKVGVIYALYQPNKVSANAEFGPIINQQSGLCLAIEGGVMAPGSDVLLLNCTGADWQQWNYDEGAGLIRSKNNPRFCLDNGGAFNNGANIMIQDCSGSSHQRFNHNPDGSISIRTFPEQVIDGYGSSPGANVGTWWNWGGINQRWTLSQ
jgi:hypothetical protein